MLQQIITILSAIGGLTALCEITFAILKYINETKRKKRYDTIKIYNELIENIYFLREKYTEKFSDSLFEHSKVCSEPSKEIYKSIMTELTKWESFARGLYYGIYDFEIYIYLVPKELSEILSALDNFAKNESIIKNYNLLFNDFSVLNHKTALCVKSKINGEKFSKKYKKVG